MSNQLGFIGGGVMAEAILSRLLAQAQSSAPASGKRLVQYQPNNVVVGEINQERRRFLQQEYGVKVTDDNTEVLNAEVVLLAIKPQSFKMVVAGLDTKQIQGCLIVSIMAGVTLNTLETAFPQQPVIRTMPNTPAIVGAGITAIAAGSRVEAGHLQQAEQILSAVGQVVQVPENLIDAVTGVSGSGPAYVAIMIEALADGGVAAGLPRSVSMQLALQTVLGTAQLLVDSQLHPAQLKDRVASPGGTTIAAVAALERAGFRSSLIEAVLAAAQRSKELGQ